MIEKYLESTNLKENAGWKDIRDLVKEAIELNVYGVCTYLHWSGIVNKNAVGSNLKKIYVIGFFTGDVRKIERDLFYVKTSGGDEFDLVFPLALLANINTKNEKCPYTALIRKTLANVRKETEGKILKVIIETNVLREMTSPEERIKEAIQFCEEAKVDIIKTNTGMFPRRIPIQLDVTEIKKHTQLPIKAAGGIKEYQLAKVLVDMGVARIGTSNAKTIIEEEGKANEKT